MTQFSLSFYINHMFVNVVLITGHTRSQESTRKMTFRLTLPTFIRVCGWHRLLFLTYNKAAVPVSRGIVFNVTWWPARPTPIAADKYITMLSALAGPIDTQHNSLLLNNCLVKCRWDTNSATVGGAKGIEEEEEKE